MLVNKQITIAGYCMFVFSGFIQLSYADDEQDFYIEEAKWDDEKNRLSIKGKGKDKDGNVASVYSATDNRFIGQDTIDDEKWRVREYNPDSVPCRVKAVSNGSRDEISVEDAPDDCDSGVTTPSSVVAVEPLSSEKSSPVVSPVSGDFTVLAANDLGMHCADQDFRIFSILPPYNVLNAQVLRKGSEPQMMSPADGVHVTYKAVNSNYFSDLTDTTRAPDAADSFTSTGTNLPGVFKNNFWETTTPVNGVDTIGTIAYDPLYPGNAVAKALLSDPTYLYGVLSLFPATPDLGLPAPDVEKLWLLGLGLHAEQSAMPGTDNIPQPFHGYVENYPFFIDFPFGYTVSNFKRYTAEGIPISAVDDIGRSNPYPLMRIEARDVDNNVLASVDTVVPVASEADCQQCHASQEVCNVDTSIGMTCDDIANTIYAAEPYNAVFIEDAIQAANVIGANNQQKVINSAKINIVRLHDVKHGTSLAGDAADGTNSDGTTNNVVCASCHYSPALDLAHLGPNDDNGKEQTQHISMSRAMHGVHGALATDERYAGLNLFPTMPPPGALRDADLAEATLMETCYNCHPGKSAKCLRGAMGGSGTVCQDCHGQMTQVGDDFTEGFPEHGFPEGADLTKRVSWASEPACDSCHVGDVIQAEALQLSDVAVNETDIHGNTDGLRLLQSYRLSDHIANGGPTNLPLLKFPNSRFATTESLYRLSGAENGNKGTGMEKGHGGLSCESCHGSTHAIWPNINPNANDNKAAKDLQGHAGTIIECGTCHKGEMDSNLDGPHGLHPVGNTKFVENHGGLAESDPQACYACHGLDGEGSVLARAATERLGLKTDFDGRDGFTKEYAKGDIVTCTDCHTTPLQ